MIPLSINDFVEHALICPILAKYDRIRPEGHGVQVYVDSMIQHIHSPWHRRWFVNWFTKPDIAFLAVLFRIKKAAGENDFFTNLVYYEIQNRKCGSGPQATCKERKGPSVDELYGRR